MRIDVVLPTYNRCDLLQKAIDSLLAAVVPEGVEARLVVVDNNSRDGTKLLVTEYVTRYPGRIHYLFEGKQGRHHALNAAIEQSSANVVAFFDDDELVERNWLVVIAQNFADPEVDYIGGEMRPDWQEAAPDWLPSSYTGVLGIVNNGDQRRQYGSPGFVAMLTGGNNAIRRSVLQRCGPYSPEFMYAEDRYMYMQLERIGAVGFYDPELVVLHYVPRKRLTKAYYRHWAFTEGLTLGKIAREKPLEVRSLFGAPLWMWRRAAEAAGDTVVRLGRSQRGRRFQSQLRLLEFWGYLSARTLRLKERYRDRTSFT